LRPETGSTQPPLPRTKRASHHSTPRRLHRTNSRSAAPVRAGHSFRRIAFTGDLAAHVIAVDAKRSATDGLRRAALVLRMTSQKTERTPVPRCARCRLHRFGDHAVTAAWCRMRSRLASAPGRSLVVPSRRLDSAVPRFRFHLEASRSRSGMLARRCKSDLTVDPALRDCWSARQPVAAIWVFQGAIGSSASSETRRSLSASSGTSWSAARPASRPPTIAATGLLDRG
jgi:hypothetical protein